MICPCCGQEVFGPELRIDPHAKQVLAHGERVKLTPNQLKVAAVLIERFRRKEYTALQDFRDALAADVLDKTIRVHLHYVKGALDRLGYDIAVIYNHGWIIEKREELAPASTQTP